MPGSFDPIAEVQIGAVAYLFGITTNGTPLGLEFLVGGSGGTPQTGGSVELDSDDVTFTWKEKENLDTTGNTQNIVKTNFKFERSIKLMPSGATRALAAAYSTELLVADTLIITNYKVGTPFNGTYRIKPGTKLSLKMDDDATIDVPCEMYQNSAQNAALTAAPISG